jgi:tetratricopeptide (TPR) repeat protein
LTRDERAVRREEARAVLEAAQDDHGLGLYWWAVAGENWHACRTAEAAAACEQALFHYGRSGVTGFRDELIWWTAAANVFGPTPVEQGIRNLEALQESVGEATILQAGLANSMARLLAMRGDIDTGRELHERARQTMRDAGLLTGAAGAAMSRAWIERRAGDHEAAERVLREGMDELERLNDRGYRSTVVVNLAECVYVQGRPAEARQLCALAREITAHDDITNLIQLHYLEGALLAHDGLLREAEEEGRRAVVLADTTDHYVERAGSRLHLATTLARADREAEAVALASEGLEIIEAKGDVTGFALWRRLLESAGVPGG